MKITANCNQLELVTLKVLSLQRLIFNLQKAINFFSPQNIPSFRLSNNSLNAADQRRASLEDKYLKKDVADPLLLQTWVEDYSDYLFRRAFRFFNNRDTAKDLVQETFLAACQGISKFEGRSSPKTWLTGILGHKIIDQLRKSSKSLEVLASQQAEDELESYFDNVEHWISDIGPRAWNTNPDNVLEQKQFMQAVQNCLGKVPEKFRQIFMLREIEGYEREEICKMLDLSSTNIGVILHRVRLGVQKCLQSNWFEPETCTK